MTKETIGQPTRVDGAICRFLCAVVMVGIMAVLIREDCAVSMFDPDQWFHWTVLFLGLFAVGACGAKFVIYIAMIGTPDFSKITGDRKLFPLYFGNEIRFYNWLLTLLVGLTMVAYELRIESDWFFVYPR